MASQQAASHTAKKKKKPTRTGGRRTTNVFSMFETAQIKEFKEAFNIIDQNRDGFIDKEDLHDMLASLGKDPTDKQLASMTSEAPGPINFTMLQSDPTEKQLASMISEAPGPINFTMFLTLFGDKLQGTDPESVIMDAFAYLDEDGAGSISEDYFRELMMTMGLRFTDEQMEEITREAPIKNGQLDYREFTHVLKHGHDGGTKKGKGDGKSSSP